MNRLANRARLGAAAGETSITSPQHPDLYALWEMELIQGASLIDSSPNGNDGTIVGPVQVAGKVGNALSFDNLDDRVDVGNPANLISGSHSVSTWVKLNSNADLETFISRGGAINTGGENFGYFFGGSFDGKLLLRRGVGTSTNYFVEGTTVLSTGVWHHAVLTYDGATGIATVYLNGVSENNANVTTSPVAFAPSFDLGNFALGETRRNISEKVLDGALDQFRIFNRVLTPAEVLELYNGGAGV